MKVTDLLGDYDPSIELDALLHCEKAEESYETVNHLYCSAVVLDADVAKYGEEWLVRHYITSLLTSFHGILDGENPLPYARFKHGTFSVGVVEKIYNSAVIPVRVVMSKRKDGYNVTMEILAGRKT